MACDWFGVLKQLKTGWDERKLLVVGDVMLDKYLSGTVDRISPEAPIPVVRAVSENERPGGAANVAMNLAGLGACVTLVGIAGNDSAGRRLESLLVEAGIEPMLVRTPGVPTTTKLRIVCGHQQMMRVDTERPPDIPDNARQALLRRSLGLLADVSAVVLSDYDKGTLSHLVCQSLIAAACRFRIPVLVDPKGRSFAKYIGATTICPNRTELAAVLNVTPPETQSLLAAAQPLLSQLQLEFMTVTLGESGIAILRQDSAQLVPAMARQVYDVSGAGDTVIAVLAMAIAGGMEIETAARLANLAAGIVVAKLGTVPIARDELLEALGEQMGTAGHEKILSFNAIQARVAGWRANGDTIVFTNGCFDLLHVGHISLLEQARHMGNRLIVGVNSDRSVCCLKGAGRPLAGQAERTQVLAALAAVDAVVVFDESTPLGLIEAVRPDVLVKGGDYTEETVIGARQISSWGGRVEIVPLVEGVSTSRLIAKSASSVPRTADSSSLAV